MELSMSNKPKIIAVVGPTASGKTSLSIALAKALGGEILSCDSMQIYRDMDIGTAKPTEEEREGIPHHLIDIVAADEPFSCAEYAALAKRTLGEVIARGKLPIFCGGTGLYLDGVLRGGSSYEKTDTDPAYRAHLERLADEQGVTAVHEMLAQIDPAAAQATHPNNVKRVIRALEIYHTTGLTKTELDSRSREVESEYDALVLGLRFPNTEELYERINMRVDMMIEQGLLDECRRLMDAGVFERSATAAQAIGYKELFPYLRGELSLESCVETLKMATRRYAKRQMTWFRMHGNVVWLDREAGMSERDLITLATDRAYDFLKA
jgi:tRNA dimethylallyltransferase